MALVQIQKSVALAADLPGSLWVILESSVGNHVVNRRQQPHTVVDIVVSNGKRGQCAILCSLGINTVGGRHCLSINMEQSIIVRDHGKNCGWVGNKLDPRNGLAAIIDCFTIYFP